MYTTQISQYQNDSDMEAQRKEKRFPCGCESGSGFPKATNFEFGFSLSDQNTDQFGPK